MTPLDIFPAAPRWVAWRNENRGRRLTKVPYGRNGHGAKADDPATWLTKDQATALEQRISNGHGGGIGYELGDVGSDTHLCGIDLDSCLDQDRKIAPWASVIVAAVSTYSEISPSGRGLKSFFYCATEDVRRFLELAGVADPNQWGLSRSNPGERPKTDHGPGIEIYMARRYFAVTGNQWPSQPDKVSLLDWPALERYAGLIPPAKSNGNGADKSANDNSRSAVAFRKGAALRRAGKSFDEMVDALQADRVTADWVREKGMPNGMRELHRIWDKAAPDESVEPGRTILVVSGLRHQAADEGIAALQAAAIAFYQRDRALVRVCEVKARSTSGEVIFVPGIAAVTPAILDRALGQAAQWRRFDPKTEKMVRIDPPRLVAGQILDMVGEWPFPPLAEVIGCPTLCP